MFLVCVQKRTYFFMMCTAKEKRIANVSLELSCTLLILIHLELCHNGHYMLSDTRNDYKHQSPWVISCSLRSNWKLGFHKTACPTKTQHKHLHFCNIIPSVNCHNKSSQFDYIHISASAYLPPWSPSLTYVSPS